MSNETEILPGFFYSLLTFASGFIGKFISEQHRQYFPKFEFWARVKNTIYMETVLVQINNSKAYKLLEGLEELDMLKALNKSISSNTNSVGKNESNIKKTMADFSGMLSESAYKSLKEHAQVARKEWERNI